MAGSANLLGIDIGSSSVKAAVLRGTRIVSKVARAAFETRFDGPCVEVDPEAVLRAVQKALRALSGAAPKLDAVALSVMSPAWLAMDKRGKPLTPLITHQDRRSVEMARQIEKTVGKSRHLRLAGNRPFPGGISSTTCGWFLAHHRQTMKRADLVGHLNTFIHRQVTGARVTDPSNASFMGLYRTTTLGGWSQELCDAIGLSGALLPDVLDSDVIAGRVTGEAAQRFGLPSGLPVLTGMVDGGASMLLAGAKVGQLLNVSGSTDVLALCTDQPRPHERLLTRALGVRRLWLSVATIAAAGSTLTWLREQFFSDLSDAAFWKLVNQAARADSAGVCFEPYLAGERVSIEQHTASFAGLTLATRRQDLLAAAVQALARASGQRVPLLQSRGVRILPRVVVSGGVQKGLGQVLHRQWPGRWSFHAERDGTLRGLGKLIPRAR